jgi:hypothetical protein
MVQCQSLSTETRPRRFQRQKVFWLLAGGIVGTGLAIVLSGLAGPASRGASPTTLEELLAVQPKRQGDVGIVRMNLLCAEGLRGTPQSNLEQCVATIQSWAARVRSETDRHRYRFQQNPSEFENSEGCFRMLMLSVVLAEDFGVNYNAEQRMAPGQARMGDGFFANARNAFLPGLLGPERHGTCSSLPVLYVAVGRHLGYPLKLVATKGHLFVRWESAGERFNIEATSRGLNCFPDDYYRHWPFELSPGEEAAERYLKSLTPAEELAVFLSTRGMCLKEAGRLPEAATAFAAAVRFAPDCRSYANVLSSLRNHLRPQRAETTLMLKTIGPTVQN